MRKAFIKTIGQLFDEDPKVVLFLGDIGAFLLRNVREKYPDRVINAGISEAAMMSAAAAMGMDGWKVFVYTITPFVTVRCLDQIRVGVGYHNANVKIVGVGGGVSYSALGATHHSIEDLAVMRCIPGMRILAPDNSNSTAQAMRKAVATYGPVYIRLTLNTPDQLDDKIKRPFKDFEILATGTQVLILSYGETLKECLLAREELKKQNIVPTVVNVASIKPLAKNIVPLVGKADYVFTIEEHSIIGGLGSVIAELIAELPNGKKPTLTRIGIRDKFVEYQGHKHQLYKKLGLDARSIARKVSLVCKKVKK